MTTHAIHALTFDLSIDTNDSDSARYAQWVQTMLLPIIDEVIEQQAIQAKVDKHRVARIQRLELDLGDVSSDMSETEIGRRLRAQLSAALFEQLELKQNITVASSSEIDAEQNDLIDFLKSGHIRWEKSGNSKYAHKRLVQDALSSPRFFELFNQLRQQPQQLLRLVRQFDTSDLFLILRQSMRNWSDKEKDLCLDWVSLELSMHAHEQQYLENLWLHVLQQNIADDQSLMKLSGTWYQQHQQKLAPTLLAYEDKLKQTSSPTRLGMFGEQECKATLNKLRHYFKQGSDATDEPTNLSQSDRLNVEHILQTLQADDFTQLADLWPQILQLLPQTLRRLHGEHWPQWVKQLPTPLAIDLLAILQPQCRWFFSHIYAQPRTSKEQQELLTKFALSWPIDTLAARTLIAFEDELARDALNSKDLHQQLETYINAYSDAGSSADIKTNIKADIKTHNIALATEQQIPSSTPPSSNPGNSNLRTIEALKHGFMQAQSANELSDLISTLHRAQTKELVASLDLNILVQQLGLLHPHSLRFLQDLVQGYSRIKDVFQILETNSKNKPADDESLTTVLGLKLALIEIGIQQGASNADARTFAANLVRRAMNYKRDKVTSVSSLIASLDALDASMASKEIRLVLLDVESSQLHWNDILPLQADTKGLRQFIAQQRTSECEKLSDAVTLSQVVTWSTSLLPHLRDFFAVFSQDREKVLVLLGVTEARLKKILWQVVLAHHQHFATTRQILTTILQQTNSRLSQHTLQIAQLKSTVGAQQFMDALTHVQHPIGESAALDSSRPVNTMLKLLEDFQSLSETEQRLQFAQLSQEQQILILETELPTIAPQASEFLSHTSIFEVWLHSSLPNARMQDIRQGVIDFFIREGISKKANLTAQSFHDALISVIASATNRERDQIEKSLQLSLDPGLTNRLQQSLPKLFSALHRSNDNKRLREEAHKAKPTAEAAANAPRLPGLLGDFRNWQRGKISLQELALELEELEQILTWWMTHISIWPTEIKASSLEKIQAASQRSYSPLEFFESVLEALRTHPLVDAAGLDELLSWQLHAQQKSLATKSTANRARKQGQIHGSAGELDFLLHEDDNAVSEGEDKNESANITSDVLLRLEKSLRSNSTWAMTKQTLQEIVLNTQSDRLEIADLYKVLNIYAEHALEDKANLTAFLRSVERHTLASTHPRDFLQKILQRLLADHEIDLEGMLALESKHLLNTNRVDFADAALTIVSDLSLSTTAKSEAYTYGESEALDGEDIHLQKWLMAQQQETVYPFLKLYVTEVLIRTLCADAGSHQTPDAISPEQIQDFIARANSKQILTLVSSILQIEAAQSRPVLASQLTQHFQLPPDLLAIALKTASAQGTQTILEQLRRAFVHSDALPAFDPSIEYTVSLTSATANNTGADSPLPKAWRQALPQLLAEAFTAPNLSRLETVWNELNQYHRQDLLQAQRRYLHQASARSRLLQLESQEKVLDLIASFSPALKSLLLQIRANAATMIKVWRVNFTDSTLFSELLNRSYHLLFTSQLAQKTSAQQLNQILQASSFWPKDKAQQALMLRSLFHSYGGAGTGREEATLLHNSLSVLCLQDTLSSCFALPAWDQEEGLAQQNKDDMLNTTPWLLPTDTLLRQLAMTAPAHRLATAWNMLEAAVATENSTAMLKPLSDQATSHILACLDPGSRAQLWAGIANAFNQEQGAVQEPDAIHVLAQHLISFRSELSLELQRSDSNVRLTTATTTAKLDSERLSVLLSSSTDLNHNEKAWIRLYMAATIAAPAPDLKTVAPLLTSVATLDRLIDVIDSVDLECLFQRLHPQLHTHLHALCQAIEQSQDGMLYDSKGFLTPETWRCIFLVARNTHAILSPQSFAKALLNMLFPQDSQQISQQMAAEKSVDISAGKHFQKLLEHARELEAQEAQQRIAEEDAKKKAQKDLKKKARLLGEEEEVPYGESNVLNAGMVIIAPYIQRLFNILELTKDSAFVSDEAAERAVHLLQYVITAEQATPEYRLALNKLLCGIHGGVPIIAGIEISDHEKNVIEQMLNGVIAHWSALGKTSIAGLRQTFLAREGQLSFVDESWQLRIPSSSFDMLLDRLPWSFAMIKFPWMREPLHVTWRQ